MDMRLFNDGYLNDTAPPNNQKNIAAKEESVSQPAQHSLAFSCLATTRMDNEDSQLLSAF